MDRRREGSGISGPCFRREALAGSLALREVRAAPAPAAEGLPSLGDPAGATQEISQGPWRGSTQSPREFSWLWGRPGRGADSGSVSGRCMNARAHAHTRSHSTHTSTHSRKEPGGMCLLQTSRGGDGWSGCPGSDHPRALQALPASSPPGSLSLHFQPSSRASLLSLFKGPLSLEETSGLAWVGSFVWVARALARPRCRRWTAERGQPLHTHTCSHTTPSGPWSAPRGRWARKGNDVVFFGSFLFVKRSCRIPQGNASLNTAEGQGPTLLACL